MVVARILTNTGLEIDQCFQAGDGNQALEVIREAPINLILSDINMPGMNGLDLIKNLKNNPETADIPVIIVTTEGTESTLEQAMTLGANGYVTKPFTPETLAEAIEKCHPGS